MEISNLKHEKSALLVHKSSFFLQLLKVKFLILSLNHDINCASSCVPSCTCWRFGVIIFVTLVELHTSFLPALLWDLGEFNCRSMCLFYWQMQHKWPAVILSHVGVKTSPARDSRNHINYQSQKGYICYIAVMKMIASMLPYVYSHINTFGKSDTVRQDAAGSKGLQANGFLHKHRTNTV